MKELRGDWIYEDEYGGNAYKFVCMRNESIAHFKRCVYDERVGEWKSTQEDIYLTDCEVKRLRCVNG